MTLAKALLYFLREASVNMLRSWKTSLLAVVTIAVSLFIGGSFLLVALNASRVVERWKQGAKVVVYLTPGAEPSEAADLLQAARGGPWVTDVQLVTAAQARQRFQEHFPSVTDLVEGWGEEPLPASLEIAFDPLKVEQKLFDEWLGELRRRPLVQVVDDDRDWLGQLEVAVRVVLGVGAILGGVLLGAAIFTIASVIRLTALLYRDEIAIMRLVGATEFYIRGPFYVEGLLQGLLGGAVALGTLYAVREGLAPGAPGSLMTGALVSSFLPWSHQLLLVGLGALSGLVGAVASLRREAL